MLKCEAFDGVNEECGMVEWSESTALFVSSQPKHLSLADAVTFL